MATILESLANINAYPIPQQALLDIASKRDLNPNGEVSKDVLMSKQYRLAKADVYMWLAEAPDISQGGQRYAFDQDQRDLFRRLADSLLDEAEDKVLGIFGYKGRLF